MLANLLARSTTVVIRFRWLVLALLVIVTVVLANGARRLHIEANPDRLLPQEHPYIQTLNDLYATFGDKNLVVIGLFPNDRRVFTPTFLISYARVGPAKKSINEGPDHLISCRIFSVNLSSARQVTN